jgi:uncharacterized protein (DUF427 family)
MKIPGPDHPITIEKNPKRVKITFNGQVIANTTRSLELREATLPPVQYIPREDVNMKLLEPSNHSTHCPYKGDAEYFSINVDGKTAENAVWYYATPYPAVAQIQDRVAFYSDRVDGIEEI